MIPNNYMAQTRSQTTNQLSFLVFSCSFLTSNQSNEWRTMKHQTRGNSPNTLIWWSHSSHFSTHTPFTSVHYMKTHTHKHHCHHVHFFMNTPEANKSLSYSVWLTWMKNGWKNIYHLSDDLLYYLSYHMISYQYQYPYQSQYHISI